VITLFPITERRLTHLSANVLSLRCGGNCWYLHFEIWCEPVAVRHVLLMERAAALSLLCSLGVLVALQLAT
jgi:hypothetical protein